MFSCVSDQTSTGICIQVPHWVLNDYENHSKDLARESNLTELIRTHLRGKVKLRLAGDLHHYTRHVPFSDKKSAPGTSKAGNTSEKPELIVSSGAVSGAMYLHRLRKIIIFFELLTMSLL